MTNTVVRSRRHTDTLLTRITICLLLTLITVGATVGTAHTHGAVSTMRDQAGAFGNANETAPSTVWLLQSGECLICKLQQQLSNSLLHAPSYTLLLLVGATPLLWLLILSLSTTRLSRRGRAPPLII